jgi:hypothetical protein
MSARDYPVTFGYKAQDGKWYGPKGKIGLYHLGNDRETPIGTLLEIAGEVIATTGDSGEVDGPHLHDQAWTGNVANTRDPAPFEFQPGRVVDVGTASQWGKYITVEVNGVNITYAHLDEIYVGAGHVIGGNMDEVQHWKDVAQSRQDSLVAIAKQKSVDYKDANDDAQVIANIKTDEARIDQLTIIVGDLEKQLLAESDKSAEQKLTEVKGLLDKAKEVLERK